jgi:hypothetical protein
MRLYPQAEDNMSREWQWIIERRTKLFLVKYKKYGSEQEGEGFFVREMDAADELEKVLRYCDNGDTISVNQVDETEGENAVYKLMNGDENGQGMVEFDEAKNCTINGKLNSEDLKG